MAESELVQVISGSRGGLLTTSCVCSPTEKREISVWFSAALFSRLFWKSQITSTARWIWPQETVTVALPPSTAVMTPLPSTTQMDSSDEVQTSGCVHSDGNTVTVTVWLMPTSERWIGASGETTMLTHSTSPDGAAVLPGAGSFSAGLVPCWLFSSGVTGRFSDASSSLSLSGVNTPMAYMA